MNGANDLEAIRVAIDDCDSELVALLAKRKALTEQVGKIKQQKGAPLHVPKREAELIKARRAEADAKGVNPDLVEDILRRMMREAYENQQSELACAAPKMSRSLSSVAKAPWVNCLRNSLGAQATKYAF